MATINGESILVEEILDVLEGDTYLGPVSPTFNDITVSDELIFLSSGNVMRIKPVALSGNRSLTFPDVSGQIIIDGGNQDLTNKTYKARQGSALAPSYGFDLYQTTGMYNDAVNPTLHFAVSGTEKLRLTTTHMFVADPIEVADGLVSTPTYSFTSNRDTGIYYESGTPSISFTVDNSKRLGITATDTINLNKVVLPAGSSSAPSLVFGTSVPDSTTGLFYELFSTIGFSCNGIEIARINGSGLTMATNRQIIAQDGTEASPSITFNGDTTTGLYRSGANELSIGVGGSQRLLIASTQFRSIMPIRSQDGSAATPGFAFANDADTGMYRSATNTLSFSAGNNERIRISTSAVNINYSNGGTSLSFIREDGGLSAGRLYMDSALDGNNFHIGATGGGSDLILETNNSEVVIAEGTNLVSRETYIDTIALSANIHIDATGFMRRATSSIKFKKDIQDYTSGLDIIDKFKPITYRNKNKVVKRIEEIEMDGVDDNGKKRKDKKVIKEQVDDDNPKRYAGFIAEWLDKEGLDMFVSYNYKGEPDNVEYARITVLLVNCIKELKDRLEVLEKK